MKNLYLIILFIPFPIMAQLEGTWQGQMTYNALSYQAKMELKVAGQKVTGNLLLHMNGVSEVSSIEANILEYSAKKSANGRITDSGNNVTNILFGMVGNQLNVSILVGAPYGGNMTGEFVRVKNETLSKSGPSPKATASLQQDQNLIGRWSKFHTYTSGGVNTEEYWDFNSDGTISGATRNSGSSYGRDINVNFNGGWVKMENFESDMALGARWFTRNNMFFYRLADGNEKLLFYYKIEHYDGRINLFLRANPNQKQPARFTRIQ